MLRKVEAVGSNFSFSSHQPLSRSSYEILSFCVGLFSKTMKRFLFFGKLLLLLPIFLSVLMTVQAFTGTYGVNYGRYGNNIPSPDQAVALLRSAKIKNVRIFDFDHTVLTAFSGSGLELEIGLPNEYLKDMSSNPDLAMKWVKENIQSFLPNTNIQGVAIGNEVLGGSDTEPAGALLGAAKNIYDSLKTLNLDDKIQVSTAHSLAVFSNSYPPSSCIFKESVVPYMKPLLQFFSKIGSPFCLNAYPFFSYMNDPENIDINYALFQDTNGIYDPKTELHYDNMFDAQIDAAYAALENAGYGQMEVIVTETGWASNGSSNEAAATLSNARTYNYNLRKRLAMRKGTPLRPKSLVKAYVFALFNENTKTGQASERNFGLFKADGTISYDIGFKGLISSSADSPPSSLKDLHRRSVSSVSILCSSSILLLLLRG